MDIKVVENALKDYKRKKSLIETTKARIEIYKKALNSPDTNWDVFLYSSPTERMLSGARDRQGGSPVEYALIKGEKRVERLKNWIQDEKSRIYPLEVETEQVEIAMKALTKQQRFIVECKYFEDMFWRDIEIGFNDTFRQQNYISQDGLKKVNREALELLAEILEPYFNRFKIG